MSLKTAHDLSIPDLLRLLNGKLGLECTRLQETPLPPPATTTLESEVSPPELVDLHPSKLYFRIQKNLTANPSDREPQSQST